MSKKVWIIIIMVLCLLLCIVGISFLFNGCIIIGPEKEVRQLLSIETETTDNAYLTIRSGSGKGLETDDLSILQQISALRLYPCIVKPFGGFSYMISIKSEEKTVDTITLAGKIVTINQKRYFANKSEVEKINSLIQELYDQPSKE